MEHEGRVFTLAQVAHPHHWVCEGSSARDVHARCKVCGATKVFNAMGNLDDGWTGTTSEYVRSDPKRTAISRARGAAKRRRR